MAKQRVSLTVSEKIVERIDELAETEGMNRSRTVEKVLQEYFSKNKLTEAVVFCGDPEAKCLDKHREKPVIKHILDHLQENGVKTAYLLAGNNQEKIESEVGKTHNKMLLEYISEDEPRGTAAALEKISGKISNSFIAVNGHVITDVDLEDMYKSHKNNNSTTTVALTAVDNPSEYGVAKLKGNKILGFEEKPEEGDEPSKLINAGTYIMEPEIFQELNSDHIGEVFEQLAEKGELSGYIYGGKWIELSA